MSADVRQLRCATVSQLNGFRFFAMKSAEDGTWMFRAPPSARREFRIYAEIVSIVTRHAADRARLNPANLSSVPVRAAPMRRTAVSALASLRLPSVPKAWWAALSAKESGITCTPSLVSTICKESWDFTPPSSPGEAEINAATLPEGKPLGRLIQSSAFLSNAV